MDRIVSRTVRSARRILLPSLAILLAMGMAQARAAEPLFFIQLTDPQFGIFGMNARNADFQQETANFEFAIATANRLKPAFVIVTGDLINKTGDPAQADAYQRIAAGLDPSIPFYQLPGNHDVGNDPTRERCAGGRLLSPRLTESRRRASGGDFTRRPIRSPPAFG